MRLIAFYLPQFHPIPENDAWWGPGFTEWTNVTKAKPNFAGHYQPHVPAEEVGYYDLRDADVLRRQAALAREHGLGGFCFYHFWFEGRRLLERPVETWLANRDIDFPFCVCWANENWSRKWDGGDDELTIAQGYSPEDDVRFLRALLPTLTDPRYVRVEGRPLLLVYRTPSLPDAAGTAARWRRVAREAGLPGLHLAAVRTMWSSDACPPGFDAVVEFPPHAFLGRANRHLPTPSKTNPRFRGKIVDYPKIVAQAVSTSVPPGAVFYRTVMPGWDNTPRRANEGSVVVGGSPRDYFLWLRFIVRQTRARYAPEHQLGFVNAWNEWGEGCHLEPDVRHGRAYLEATRDALRAEDASDGDAADLAIYAPHQALREASLELERSRNGRGYGSLVDLARRALTRIPRVKGVLKRRFGTPRR